MRRVAAARGLDEAVVQRLVDSLTQKPWLGLFGTTKVNVLRLNIALETLQPNVTASAGVRQAGGCGRVYPRKTNGNYMKRIWKRKLKRINI